MKRNLTSLLVKLKPLTSNFYVKAFGVLTATGVSDFVWARYMRNISDGNAIVASNWAFFVIVLGAFIVVSYVQDKRLILPAAIGAWIGTYLAV